VHEPWIVPIVFFAIFPIIFLGTPLARALARRWDRDAAAPKIPPEVMARLERIEQAVDSIAVEVERISEGQRFTTKLLTERTRDTTTDPAQAPTRGLTP